MAPDHGRDRPKGGLKHQTFDTVDLGDTIRPATGKSAEHALQAQTLPVHKIP